MSKIAFKDLEILTFEKSLGWDLIKVSRLLEKNNFPKPKYIKNLDTVIEVSFIDKIEEREKNSEVIELKVDGNKLEEKKFKNKILNTGIKIWINGKKVLKTGRKVAKAVANETLDVLEFGGKVTGSVAKITKDVHSVKTGIEKTTGVDLNIVNRKKNKENRKLHNEELKYIKRKEKEHDRNINRLERKKDNIQIMRIRHKLQKELLEERRKLKDYKSAKVTVEDKMLIDEVDKQELIDF